MWGGLDGGIAPGATLTLSAPATPGGGSRGITVTVRLDSETEVAYYRHGGIVPFVYRRLTSRAGDHR